MADDETPVDPRPSKATPLEAGDPVEQPSVTGRPSDVAGPNTTFADRVKQRKASEKRVSEAANKAVLADEDAPQKKARRK